MAYIKDCNDKEICINGEIIVYADEATYGVSMITLSGAEGFVHMLDGEAIAAARAILKHFGES